MWHTNTQTRTHQNTHTHTRTHIHAHTYTHTRTHAHTYTQTHKHTHTDTTQTHTHAPHKDANSHAPHKDANSRARQAVTTAPKLLRHPPPATPSPAVVSQAPRILPPSTHATPAIHTSTAETSSNLHQVRVSVRVCVCVLVGGRLCEKLHQRP